MFRLTMHYMPPLCLAAALIIFSQRTLNAQSEMPDSLELREAFDHCDLFNGQIEIGRTHTKLYFGGEGLDRLKLKAFNASKESLDFDYDDDARRYTIDYLILPIIDLSFDGQYYRLAVELIQVDWPDNEINWRMVPLVTFQKFD